MRKLCAILLFAICFGAVPQKAQAAWKKDHTWALVGGVGAVLCAGGAWYFFDKAGRLEPCEVDGEIIDPEEQEKLYKTIGWLLVSGAVVSGTFGGYKLYRASQADDDGNGNGGNGNGGDNPGGDNGNGGDNTGTGGNDSDAGGNDTGTGDNPGGDNGNGGGNDNPGGDNGNGGDNTNTGDNTGTGGNDDDEFDDIVNQDIDDPNDPVARRRREQALLQNPRGNNPQSGGGQAYGVDYDSDTGADWNSGWNTDTDSDADSGFPSDTDIDRSLNPEVDFMNYNREDEDQGDQDGAVKQENSEPPVDPVDAAFAAGDEESGEVIDIENKKKKTRRRRSRKRIGKKKRKKRRRRLFKNKPRKIIRRGEEKTVYVDPDFPTDEEN